MFQSNGPTFVRRRQGEKFRNKCVVPTVKFGGRAIMIWGTMSYHGTGLLTRISANLNGEQSISILSDSAVPSTHYLGYGDNFARQDDGAACHRATVVNKWKHEQGIRTLVCQNQVNVRHFWGDFIPL